MVVGRGATLLGKLPSFVYCGLWEPKLFDVQLLIYMGTMYQKAFPDLLSVSEATGLT